MNADVARRLLGRLPPLATDASGSGTAVVESARSDTGPTAGETDRPGQYYARENESEGEGAAEATGGASTSGRTVLDEWPVEQTVYLTLDLEADYAGLLDGSCEAAGHVDALVDVLERYGVPLTCFLQTELLEAAPGAVERLADSRVPVEFHAHSHTHSQRDGADVRAEVERSTELVRERFGTEPLGYRFPEGIMRPADYAALADADVAFDASLFPSWRPDVASVNGYSNVAEPTRPFRDDGTGIVELPFTVYSERLRVPVALSYLKLLGAPYQELVRRRPPSAVVFDFHMHDLVAPSARHALPPAYRAIYGRNPDAGVDIFERLVATLRGRGYHFGRMSELYDATAAALDGRPQERGDGA